MSGLETGETNPGQLGPLVVVFGYTFSCIYTPKHPLTHNYPTQTPTHNHAHTHTHTHARTHTLKVLGWYHSHPHITVWPSHVDVGTQADYQLMDDNFIGLIFSCFNDSERVSLLHV